MGAEGKRSSSRRLNVRPDSISSFLESDVLPRLAAELIYSHPAHDWKHDAEDKLKGGCPWHQSKTGTSFVVTKASRLWWCEGCKVGGGPIQYLARLKGLKGPVRGSDFVRLAHELAAMAGLELPTQILDEEQIRHLQMLERRRACLERIVSLCERQLASEGGEEAREYLQNVRGFEAEDFKTLRFGLYPPIELVQAAIKEAGLDWQIARLSGLFNPELEGQVVVPGCDERGCLLTLYFRRPHKDADPAEKTRSLPGEETKRTPLYLDRALRHGHKKIVVVEGFLDAAMAQMRSDTSVVACVSASLSQGQVRTLVRCGIEEVTICLDADTAGDSGVPRCIKSLERVEIGTRVAPRLPEDVDPDDFILKHGIEAWRVHLRAAVSGSRFRVLRIVEKHTPTDWEGWNAILEASAAEGLEREAASHLIESWLASSPDGKALAQAAIESPAIVRALSSKIVNDRRLFEAALERLRSHGATTRQVASLEKAAQADRKSRKNEPQPAGERELELVPPELNAPVSADLMLPAGVSIDRNGILVDQGEDKGTKRIIATPVLIRSRFRDINEGTELIDLVWKRDGVWRSHVTERNVVANTKDIVGLSAFGLPVTSLNARDLVDYLSAFETLNLPRLRPRTVSRQLGWVSSRYDQFLWGEKLITAAGIHGPDVTAESGALEDHVQFRPPDAGESELAQGYCQSGDLEDWQRIVAPLRDFPRLIIGLLASLSTPLIPIIGAANPIVSFSARTSRGKTTSLRIAASAWGVAHESSHGTLIRSWDSTRVFIERYGATINNLPLFLDETSLVRSDAAVAQVIYSISQGQGRGRGSTTGMRRSARWCLAALSTGERPLTSFSADHGGTHARVLELEGSPFGDEDQSQLVASLNAGILQHYGHAGPALVEYLIGKADSFETLRKKYAMLTAESIETFAGNSVAARMASSLALLVLTAKMCCTGEAGIVPWSFEELTPVFDELAAVALRAAKSSDVDRRALQEVTSWASRHRHRFVTGSQKRTREEEPNDGWAGRWDCDGDSWDCLYFFPDKLKWVLTQAGFTADAVFSAWHDRGWLDVQPGRRKKSIRVLGRTQYLIAIKRSAIESAEGEDEPETEDPTDDNDDRSGSTDDSASN